MSVFIVWLKNQLSLTINNSNEFEVIDYLNDGASRSVKRFQEVKFSSFMFGFALAESVHL
jgi:exonuclease SbcC